MLVDVVVRVLVDGAADALSSLDRLAHRTSVLVLMLQTVEQVRLLGLHLRDGLASNFGLDLGLVLLLLVDEVGNGLDSVFCRVRGHKGSVRCGWASEERE